MVTVNTQTKNNPLTRFLIPRLLINTLVKTSRSVKAVRDALDQLPRDLDSLLDDTMKRILGSLEVDREVGMNPPNLSYLRASYSAQFVYMIIPGVRAEWRDCENYISAP